jgi:hypothetical protein
MTELAIFLQLTHVITSRFDKIYTYKYIHIILMMLLANVESYITYILTYTTLYIDSGYQGNSVGLLKFLASTSSIPHFSGIPGQYRYFQNG